MFSNTIVVVIVVFPFWKLINNEKRRKSDEGEGSKEDIVAEADAVVLDGTQAIVDETISDSKFDREYVVVDDAIGTVGFGVIIGVITVVSLVVGVVAKVVGDGVISGTGANVVIIMDVVVTL